MKPASLRNIRHLSLEEIIEYLESIGEKKFRAAQIWDWIWQLNAQSFADMSNLSKELREKLGQSFTLPVLVVDATQISADGTIKSIHANAVPHSTETIPSQFPVRAVLEINGGSAKLLGIKPGDKVLHPIFGNA